MYSFVLATAVISMVAVIGNAQQREAFKALAEG